MKTIGIKKRTLNTFILAVAILKPVGIDAFAPALNLSMNALKLIAMCVLFFKFLVKIRKLRKIENSILFVLGMEVITIIVDSVNMKSPYSAIIYWQSIISLMILADTYSDKQMNECLNIISFVYKIYVAVDLITLILWSNGYNNSRIYFLGNKNMHILYILPMMILLLYQKATEKQKKYNIEICLWWIVSFYIIFTTKSSTSIIAIVLLLLYYIMFYKTKCEKLFRGIKASVVCSIIFGINIVLVFMGISGIFSYLANELFGKDATLTGRIFIWPRAVEMFLDNPMGYGWDAVVTDVYGGFNYWFGNVVSVGHAHNLILTIAYKCGIIGLLIFILYIIYIIRAFDQNRKFACLDRDVQNVLRMFFYIFMTISILDAYPTNCIGLFFACYLITRLSKSECVGIINKAGGCYGETFNNRKS